MQYITVDREYEPKIIGTNRISPLEFKKNSFLNKEDEKFFFAHLNDFGKASINSFEPFNPKLLQKEITLYPVGKRVKKLDFMAVSPRLYGIWTSVSEKALTIIQKYKLPEYTLIPVNVETYDEKYYLIGFPLVTVEYFDYSKSKFTNRKTCEIITFSNEQEYKDEFFASPKNIILKKAYNYDIINVATVVEMCFSEKLANDLLENGCTGLRFKSLDNISVCTL